MNFFKNLSKKKKQPINQARNITITISLTDFVRVDEYDLEECKYSSSIYVEGSDATASIISTELRKWANKIYPHKDLLISEALVKMQNDNRTSKS